MWESSRRLGPKLVFLLGAASLTERKPKHVSSSSAPVSHCWYFQTPSHCLFHDIIQYFRDTSSSSAPPFSFVPSSLPASHDFSSFYFCYWMFKVIKFPPMFLWFMLCGRKKTKQNTSSNGCFLRARAWQLRNVWIPQRQRGVEKVPKDDNMLK